MLLHHLGNESLCLPSSYSATSFIFFPNAQGCDHTPLVQNYLYASSPGLLGALILPSLLFGGQPAMLCCLADFRCWQQGEGNSSVVLWRSRCRYASISKIQPAPLLLAGFTGDKMELDRRAKRLRSVRQQACSQRLRALEIS